MIYLCLYRLSSQQQLDENVQQDKAQVGPTEIH